MRWRPYCWPAATPVRIAACKPGDNVICGIARPEDLEIVPGTRWLMVSELGSGKPGRILLADPDTKEVRVIADKAPTPTETETFPRCGAPPENLHPRGFHLSQAEDGSLRLLVINSVRVERYRVTVAGDDVTLQWEGCVDVPKEVAPNDIASIGDSGFVLSHMYTVPRDVPDVDRQADTRPQHRRGLSLDAGRRVVPHPQ